MRTMRRWLQVLGVMLLASLVLAGTAAAQGQGQGQGRGRGPGGAGPSLLRDTLPGRGPIELLLARRDSIPLTPDQVRALEQLDRSLQQQNAPHVRALVELRREIQPLIGMHPRDMTTDQRAQFAKQAERARPLMAQVQQNNQRAMERVGELLTPEQKQRLRGWLQGPRRGGPPIPLEP